MKEKQPDNAQKHGMNCYNNDINSSPQSTLQTVENMAALVHANGVLRTEIETLKHQLDWFRRQIFGKKSERIATHISDQQMSLVEVGCAGESGSPVTPPAKIIAAHTRRQHAKPGGDESTLFFDDQRLPIEVITVPNPETAGLAADEFDVIGEKVSHRLAQRPGSYVILKYVRAVIKRHDSASFLARLRRRASLRGAGPMSASLQACSSISLPIISRYTGSTCAWAITASR